MLSVKNLEAGYGKVKVLHGISLEVPRAKVVTLIGSNGAGKTTAMRVLSGMIKPSCGEIYLGGKRIDRMESFRIARLGLAHSPEGRRVFPTLSVNDNLTLGAFTRLTGCRARAIMLNPVLVLLDEPSMGLAPILVEEVFRIIARLKEQGITMLLVEQFAAAALKVADYGYVLENGRISVHGSADKLQHDQAVVAAYLGGAAH